MLQKSKPMPLRTSSSDDISLKCNPNSGCLTTREFLKSRVLTLRERRDQKFSFSKICIMS